MEPTTNGPGNAPQNQPAPAVIKWTKFYDTVTGTVATYHNEQKTADNDGQTFEFTTPEEMISKSTVETFNFWNNTPIGVGSVPA